MCSGRQSRPHLFHVVRKVCTKSGHVSTIPPVVKNNSHHGISTIKSDYPDFYALDKIFCLFGTDFHDLTIGNCGKMWELVGASLRDAGPTGMKD